MPVTMTALAADVIACGMSLMFLVVLFCRSNGAFLMTKKDKNCNAIALRCDMKHQVTV